MTKAKHTPGPWHIGNGPEGLRSDSWIEGPEGQAVAIAQGFLHQDWGANARLIAAAPDGLALADMVIAWSNGLRHRTAHEAKMVNAALAFRAKATGG